MAPDPAAGFALGIECAGEISSRVNPDSAEFGHQALSSSGLTRGSCFVATVEVVVEQQDPRVEPEDDAVGGRVSGVSGNGDVVGQHHQGAAAGVGDIFGFGVGSAVEVAGEGHLAVGEFRRRDASERRKRAGQAGGVGA